MELAKEIITRSDSIPQLRARLVRYMVARVARGDFCVHDFSARCKRGIEWREEARCRPIPRHRALTIRSQE